MRLAALDDVRNYAVSVENAIDVDLKLHATPLLIGRIVAVPREAVPVTLGLERKSFRN